MGKWDMVRLGDVCSILNGFAFKSENYVNDGYRVIRITNVQKGIIADSDPKYYVESEELTKYELFNGDLLISLTGNVGRVGLVPSQLLPAYLNQRVACIRIKDLRKIVKEYIFRYLNSDIFERMSIDAANGIAQKNLSTEWLKQTLIPLPPLDVQQKIADVLDKASALIELRKAQLDKLDLLVKSQFIEMFGDLKTNSMNWEIHSFSYVATIDTQMTTNFKQYADCPHIGIESIERDTGCILEYELVKDSDLKSGKYLFDSRHLVYSKIRPNLNKVAKPQFSGLCSADAYPVLPTTKSNRDFLAVVFRSDFFLDYILAFSGRTNIPKVNKQQLEGFSLPVPPVDLQNEFAAFVALVEEQKKLLQQSLSILERNYVSLMQKCLRGELF